MEALPPPPSSWIAFLRASSAVFQSRTRKADTPKVFQNNQFVGMDSTAFRAKASARFGSNQGSPGTLASIQARLLWTRSLSGSSMMDIRKLIVADPGGHR